MGEIEIVPMSMTMRGKQEKRKNPLAFTLTVGNDEEGKDNDIHADIRALNLDMQEHRGIPTERPQHPEGQRVNLPTLQSVQKSWPMVIVIVDRNGFRIDVTQMSNDSMMCEQRKEKVAWIVTYKLRE